MSDAAFAQLAEPIRRVLWKMRWTNLRPIQEQAISVISGTEQDLLISARTASGKTEAAFLPILSRICDNPVASVRAIYIGPLKALINDQFRRVEDLCEHADIPVHRWHGDVPQQRKKALLARPSGVLLITPESIESLFVNQSSALRSLFHSLSFVVIDELHSLIDCERGTHLRSLLYRLERTCIAPFRLIALSATLGDLPLSARWMRPTSPESVQILTDPSSLKKSVKFRICGYRRPHPQNGASPGVGDSEDSSAAPPAEMCLDMYLAFRDTKNLLFANARADVESFGDQLSQYAIKDGFPDRFLVHHGSLSRQIREHTETRMQEDSPHTTVCSATLELGIDIGNVAAVGQIGCPWSVSSLIQRLGRSGRKDDEPHVMRLYVLEDEAGPRASLCERLYPELLRSIALTELMLQRWVEPPEVPAFDFSTLSQQILSVIAETGGVAVQELFDRLITQGAFRRIERRHFADLLRNLSERDLIEQMPSGDLILGLAGETIVRHYEFYSAFASPPEYRIVHGSTPLGTLPVRYLPRADDHILFAGRRWMVTAIDDQRKEISVRPAKGRKKPKFQGMTGTVHPQVRLMMRDVLLDDRPIKYLNAEATAMLTDARQTARDAGLHQGSIIALSGSSSLWFTWTGTRAHGTLALMAEMAGISCTDHEGLAFEFSLNCSELKSELRRLVTNSEDPMPLAQLLEPKQHRKYDEFISESLLEAAIATDVLDVDSARAAVSMALDS